MGPIMKDQFASNTPESVAVTQHPPIEAPATAIDPICGMSVDIASARWTLDRDGQTYYFCAPGCKRQFQRA